MNAAFTFQSALSLARARFARLLRVARTGGRDRARRWRLSPQRLSARLAFVSALSAFLITRLLQDSAPETSLLLLLIASVLTMLPARVFIAGSALFLGAGAWAFARGQAETADQLLTYMFYAVLAGVVRQFLETVFTETARGKAIVRLGARIERWHYRVWRSGILLVAAGTVVALRAMRSALQSGGALVAVGGGRLLRVSERALNVILRVTISLARFLYRVIVRSPELLPRVVRDLLGRGMRGAWRRTLTLTLLALLAVPFFWFRHGEGDFGGDATRLYFYDPLNWLRSAALAAIHSSGYGFENPHFFLLPFLLLLSGLNILLSERTSLVLAIFNGGLLALAFLSVYAVIRDLHEGRETARETRMGAFLGAAFFLFSQIVMYQWQRYLYTFHMIAVYPAFVWLALQYLKRAQWRFLFYGLLLTVVFSETFSAEAAPNWASFFFFALILLGAYACIFRKVRAFLRGSFVFLLLFLPLHAFHLLPQIVSLLTPGTAFHEALFSVHAPQDRGLNYFLSVHPFIRLLYNVVGFHQYSLYEKTGASPVLLAMLSRYGVHYLHAFLVFPFVVLSGLFLSARDRHQKQTVLFRIVVLLFLVALFLVTANLFGSLGPSVYAKLFSVPWFSMFRSFHGVFSVPFMFVYAVTLGMALRFVLGRIRHPFAQRSIAGVLLLLLLYNAVPFLTGQIANITLADTKGVKLSHRFPKEFEDALAWARGTQLDAKWTTLPWTQYDYQVIEGKDGGAYVGPSPLAYLAQKHLFSGMWAFDFPDSALFNHSFLLERIRVSDYRSVNRMLSLLNIGFIFQNSSPSAYRDAFVGWPYSQEIWDAFPRSADFQVLLDRLGGFQNVFARPPYAVYQYPEAFLPHLFVPLSMVISPHPDELKNLLLTKSSFDLPIAFVLRESDNESVLNTIPRDSNPKELPQVEFKKISAVKYRIRLHRMRLPGNVPQDPRGAFPTSFPLVFSEAHHRGWKLFLGVPPAGGCAQEKNPMRDTAQPGSANAEEIRAACAQGLLSATGPDFISTVFHGVTQNQNLPTGALWETWRLPALEEKYHLRANEYANAWWVDLDYLRKQFPHALQERPEGGADLELILEFTPQRFFYLGTVISLVTLAGVITLLYTGVAKRAHAAFFPGKKPRDRHPGGPGAR